MDLEQAARQLMAGKNGAALQQITQSQEGARLAARFDGAKLERAAQAGDTQALAALLKDVLSTPEGRSFAAQVQKAVDGHGR